MKPLMLRENISNSLRFRSFWLWIFFPQALYSMVGPSRIGLRRGFFQQGVEGSVDTTYLLSPFSEVYSKMRFCIKNDRW